MGAVFLQRAAVYAYIALAVHADDQHVHVVIAAGAAVGQDVPLLPEQRFDRGPGIHDIPRRAPHIRAGGTDPFGGIVRAPAAGAENDVPAGGFERHAHPVVEQPPVNGIRFVAIIVFQEIHAPVGKRLRVLELMAETARIARAGFGPHAGIHPELESEAVYVVGQVLHAVGEESRIGDQSAVRVPVLERPAVVDDDIIVTRVFQSAFCHGLGRFPDEGVVNVGAEGVPGIPALQRSSHLHVFSLHFSSEWSAVNRRVHSSIPVRPFQWAVYAFSLSKDAVYPDELLCISSKAVTHFPFRNTMSVGARSRSRYRGLLPNNTLEG